MLKLLFYIVGIYLCFLVLLYFFQRSLIYYPDRTDYTPQEAGVPEMEVVQLETEDGLKIKSWYHPPTVAHAPTIVYFHGNAGNIAHRAFIASSFLNQGYGFLLVTYRGYSGNEGRPSEQGLYRDARAAMAFVKNQGVPFKCTVLYGNSIGAAVAVQMATEYPVGALILQSPFSTAVDVASIHYAFFLPMKGLIKDKYDSISKADKIQSPVFIIHGKNDTIIPPELSRKLFSLLPEPKEAEYIPWKGHNDLFEPERVIQFIKNYVTCDS